MPTALAGYQVTKQIGTGAGSLISMATEIKTGRTVAIKHVVRESSNDDKFVQQAETEFDIGSKVEHPNLRQFYSIHRVRKLLSVKEVLVVMEYIDGMNLEEARPNRLNTFLVLFRKIAAGLGAMHNAGYVHSDIKPINIMIAKGGTVKIIDFGQSCPMYHRKERIQGTPDYIAPEQVHKKPLDQRTDIFNLGATMYWLLTSENYPTAIQETNALDGVHLPGEKPVAPIELNAKIPLSLSQLVMQCCRDNPTQRPNDMAQVIGRLEVIQRLWQAERDELRASRDTTTTPQQVSRSDKDQE